MSKKYQMNQMISKMISEILSILKEDLKNENLTELEYQNPFTLLIAIILSAQSTDRMVNIATKDLFEKIQSPSDVLHLGQNNFAKMINRINYYKTKAKNIYNTSIILNEIHDDVIPNTFEELIKLPGVGRKTANVFLNVCHKKNTIGVDTHIFRVVSRLFDIKFKNPFEVEDFLMKNVKEIDIHLHYLLVLHGRYICLSKKPKCDLCKLQKMCLWKEKII